MDDLERNRILEKIQQQKQKALDLNILELVEHLYDQLRYLDAALKHGNCILEAAISDARCIQDESRLKKIFFKMKNGNEYAVVYQHNGSPRNFEMYGDHSVEGGYEFSMYEGEMKILGVLFQCESDNELPFSFYRALDISAFREGGWIQDLQELHRIERAYTHSLLAKIKDEELEKKDEELKQLKEDFGIENG